MDYEATQMNYLFKQKKERSYGDGNEFSGAGSTASQTLQLQRIGKTLWREL